MPGRLEFTERNKDAWRLSDNNPRGSASIEERIEEGKRVALLPSRSRLYYRVVDDNGTVVWASDGSVPETRMIPQNRPAGRRFRC